MPRTSKFLNSVELFCGGNPKLFTRLHKDQTAVFFLEYYLGEENEFLFDESGAPVLYTDGKMMGRHKRKYKTRRKRVNIPDLFIFTKPKSQRERIFNIEQERLAKKIREDADTEFKLTKSIFGAIKIDDGENHFDFIGYFKEYSDKYDLKDVRMIKYAIKCFKTFLSSNEKYKGFTERLEPKDFTKAMVREFADYLYKNGSGTGPQTTFKRFKKIIKRAFDDELIDKNPCDGIAVKTKEDVTIKEILTWEEIAKLNATSVAEDQEVVRQAFLFSVSTGMRFCDVKNLTYANVDFGKKILTFEQSKTKGYSKASRVDLPMTDFHFGLIGKGDRNEKIFKLPKQDACTYILKKWVERAGIGKHITWHCARHTFCSLSANNGISTSITASMAGHANLNQTMQYTHGMDQAKRDAMEKLINGFTLS